MVQTLPLSCGPCTCLRSALQGVRDFPHQCGIPVTTVTAWWPRTFTTAYVFRTCVTWCDCCVCSLIQFPRRNHSRSDTYAINKGWTIASWGCVLLWVNICSWPSQSSRQWRGDASPLCMLFRVFFIQSYLSFFFKLHIPFTISHMWFWSKMPPSMVQRAGDSSSFHCQRLHGNGKQIPCIILETINKSATYLISKWPAYAAHGPLVEEPLCTDWQLGVEWEWWSAFSIIP